MFHVVGLLEPSVVRGYFMFHVVGLFTLRQNSNIYIYIYIIILLYYYIVYVCVPAIWRRE